MRASKKPAAPAAGNRPRFKVANNSTHILNLNVRREGPEDERVLAVDLKLDFPMVQWHLCTYFDPCLVPFLWRGEIDANAHAQTQLIQRNTYLAPVSYGNEIQNARLEVGGLRFNGVTVKRFVIEPRDGGVFNLGCVASFRPSDRELAELAHSMARETEAVLLEEEADLFNQEEQPVGKTAAPKAQTSAPAAPAAAAVQAAPESPEQIEERLYAAAVESVRKRGEVSTSNIQRSLSVGYARASDLIVRMELEGVVGPPDEKGKRQLLQPREKLTLKAKGKKGEDGAVAG